MSKKEVKKLLTVDEVTELVEKYLLAKKRARKAYERADKLLDELVTMRVRSVTLSDGRVARKVDNFRDPKTGKARNVAFRAHGIRRFDWEVVKEDK